MKLPLCVHYDNFGKTLVADANHKVVYSETDAPEVRAFARDMVRKFNHDWRYRFFGQQPYEYTVQDWFFERNEGVK